MSFAVGKTQLAYSRIWHVVDARGQVLGRMGTQISTMLMGKHKRVYEQSLDCGDHVVVINAKDVAVTGKKAHQKVYRTHSTYPGGMREVPFAVMAEKRPERIVEKAVSGMLPKNKLRDARLARLHVFADARHPYAQNIVQRHDEDWSGVAQKS